MAAARSVSPAAELTAWARAAPAKQSFGALPVHLQVFVQSVGLSELRTLVADDVEERIACVKRREQNQRALESRRAKQLAAERDLQRAAAAHQLHAEMLASHLATLQEHDEFVQQFEDDRFELFSPEVMAAQLFEGLQNGGSVSTVGRGGALEDDDGDEQVRLPAGILSELFVAQAPGKERAARGAAADG